MLDGVVLPLKTQGRNFEVQLDLGLLLGSQAEAIARRVYYQHRLVHQLHLYLEKRNLATVVHALVTFRLNYCNAVYVGLPLTTS